MILSHNGNVKAAGTKATLLADFSVIVESLLQRKVLSKDLLEVVYEMSDFKNEKCDYLDIERMKKDLGV